MTDKTLTEKFWQYVGQTSSFPPSLQVDHAAGNWITDADGRRYLDFISGIAVTTVGHCHPKVVKAVQAQAASYAHTMVYGEHIQSPQVLLAEKIASIAPAGLDCTYFLTTGAEANDAALKLAVKHTRRRRFVAFRHAYHGDTAGAMSCFGSSHFREQFPGLLADVQFLPFNDIPALKAIDQTVAAVLVEPIQGEGGMHPPVPGFLLALRDACTQSGSLLIFDEVQTGFGRTGEWFAAQTYGVTPDLITMAKGMGAGYPLAGMLGPRQLIYDFAAVPDFSHITTFGGHPVSCAAGLAALEVIEENNLLLNVRDQGRFLLAQLNELVGLHPNLFADARGVGLMIGLECTTSTLARRIVDQAREMGVIIESNLLDEATIRFSPAYTISREECNQAMAILHKVIAVVTD